MVNKIVILGSLNLDSILQISRLPQPGETLSMIEKNSAPGGKGANQAVAAARTGKAQTAFIGRVGQDETGNFLLKTLKKDHINTNHIVIDHQKDTGQAYILLQSTTGQNSILVYGGANQNLSQADVENAHSIIKEADFLISQFETPVEVTNAAFVYAHSVGVKTILNPAPALNQIPDQLLASTDLVCPNETEAQALSNIQVTDLNSMRQTAIFFQNQGCTRTIITVGARGAYIYDNLQKIDQFVPAFKVKAIDTTAAGDTFIGALGAVLKSDFSNLVDATLYANRASSLAVQKLGAQPSIPTSDQVCSHFKH